MNIFRLRVRCPVFRTSVPEMQIPRAVCSHGLSRLHIAIARWPSVATNYLHYISFQCQYIFIAHIYLALARLPFSFPIIFHPTMISRTISDLKRGLNEIGAVHGNACLSTRAVRGLGPRSRDVLTVRLLKFTPQAHTLHCCTRQAHLTNLLTHRSLPARYIPPNS